MVVEDADRLTDQAANALLKAIEEPTDRTVWLLCAPTVEDVLPTIRSRTRLVVLSTPSVDDVTDFLVRTEGLAGRDRVVRRPRQPGPHRPGPRPGPRRGHPSSSPRGRRRSRAGSPRSAPASRPPPTCTTSPRRRPTRSPPTHDQREKAELDRAYGVVERGRRPREYAPALRDLEKSQKTRAKRRHLDVVDRGPDGPRLGLPRRAHPPARRGRRPGQRGGARRRRRAGQRLVRGAEPAPGSRRSSRPASRCWSSTSRRCWRSSR